MKGWYVTLIGFAVLFAIGLMIGLEINPVVEHHYDDSFGGYFQMRDLFTPAYNDTVTVEPAGYDDGWLFWVNHSRVLNSFYFNNQKDYLIRINVLYDIIEVIN